MGRKEEWETVALVTAHVYARGASGARSLSAWSIAVALDKLSRIARTLHRFYEAQCNGETDNRTCRECGGLREKHTYRDCLGARVVVLQERAIEIGNELGIVVENQTDPRGAAIKLWTADEDRGGRLLGAF